MKSNRMKKIITLIILTVIGITTFSQSSFLADQKRYGRVRTAISEKESIVIQKLKPHQIKLSELNILILAFKTEGQIDIMVKRKSDPTYIKLETYKICASSGELGPKRQRGDYQVPEGFYHIDRFNPASSFYLSLGINYPNLGDKRKSTASQLGGDIFIHGDCVTIGCLPMTDDKIKEIYLYAIHAKNNGQSKIPVYIFPFRMTSQKMAEYQNSTSPEVISLWKNLKIGYDLFYAKSKELNISTSQVGDYIFK
jgi:murein L,D-transpeptidase YafK